MTIHGEDAVNLALAGLKTCSLVAFAACHVSITVFNSKIHKDCLTLGSSKLPKLKPLPWLCRLEGGLPPLAAGCGIGEGDVAGDVIRGF